MWHCKEYVVLIRTLKVDTATRFVLEGLASGLLARTVPRPLVTVERPSGTW